MKTGPLVFSDIVHGDSWPRYLVTDAALFLEKKIGGPNLRITGLIHIQNEVFCYFLYFRLYVFLEIACDDGFWQFLTSSRGETQEQTLGTQIWGKRAKNVTKIKFFLPFSQVWFINFALKYTGWWLGTMFNYQ